jgi:sugar phosphate permease
MVEGEGIGILAQRYGWTVALNAVVAATAIAIVLLSFTWKLSPHSASNSGAAPAKAPRQAGRAA